MGGGRAEVERNASPLILNLGCGMRKMPGVVNVDINEDFNPDVLLDLTQYPWPWTGVSGIYCSHVLEHIVDWWRFFSECVAVTDPGGFIHITVPDWADLDARTVRSHLHTFSLQSFKNRVHGIRDQYMQEDPAGYLPVKLVAYYRIVHKDKMHWWIPKKAMRWLMDHAVGYCIEQKFEFVKL